MERRVLWIWGWERRVRRRVERVCEVVVLVMVRIGVGSSSMRRMRLEGACWVRVVMA